MSTSLLLDIPRQVSLSPSFHTIISRINRAFSQQRPWQELVEITSFSRPQSFSEATTRIRKNLPYFWTNYLTLLAIVLAISLISHPLSFIALLLLVFGWIFLYFFKPNDHTFTLFGQPISNSQILAFLVVATVATLIFTSVASLLIFAVLVGGAIVCVHGACRDPMDLFLDEQDRISSSFSASMREGASIV